MATCQACQKDTFASLVKLLSWGGRRAKFPLFRSAPGTFLRARAGTSSQEHDQRAIGAFLNYTERISISEEEIW